MFRFLSCTIWYALTNKEIFALLLKNLPLKGLNPSEPGSFLRSYPYRRKSFHTRAISQEDRTAQTLKPRMLEYLKNEPYAMLIKSRDKLHLFSAAVEWRFS